MTEGEGGFGRAAGAAGSTCCVVPEGGALMGLWEALRDEIVGVGVVLSVGEGVEGERGSGASGKGWGGTS